jgi:ubiquinone/menaquinone biosynthesis C-methylase UbiE
MEHTTKIHMKQYSTSDFEKHKSMTGIGLTEDEKFIISKHLNNPQLQTLEIGCGTGRISFGMEKDLGFKFSNIIATDFVEKFIGTAKEIAGERRSSIKFESCSATELPFKDGTFQYVVCLGVVLSHLPYRKQRMAALNECYRVLKDDGVLLINTMNFFSEKWYMPYLKWLVKLSRLVRNPYHYSNSSLPRLGSNGKLDLKFLRKDKPVLHYYHSDELVYDLLSSGFSVTDLMTTAYDMKDAGSDRFLRSGQNIYVVGRR